MYQLFVGQKIGGLTTTNRRTDIHKGETFGKKIGRSWGNFVLSSTRRKKEHIHKA